LYEAEEAERRAVGAPLDPGPGPLLGLVAKRRDQYGRAMPAARFLTDSSLDYLARRLRFLGFDVVTLPGARLEEVLAEARRQGRTVLTLSTRRPRRWTDVPAIAVARGDEAGAVRMLAAAYEPAGAPFSRCAECNTALERRHAFAAQGEVPARALRGAPFLHYCPGCGKWYWEGSHVRRIRDWLELALGRPLEPPAPPTGDSAPMGG
jgi:hypothetical protein